MANWNPRDEMTTITYIMFKLRMWVFVNSAPEWVLGAERQYFEGFRKKHGHRPYHQEEIFKGDSLLYKVKYKVPRQGECIPEFYVKIR